MTLDSRWSTVTWLIAAAAVGLTVSGVFSRVLGWGRWAFVAPHAAAVLALTAAYVHATGLSVRTQLRRRWIAGLLGGLILGAILVRSVTGQPPSVAAEGLALAADLAWLGLVYGVADALLLTILPVIAIYGRRPADALARPLPRLGWAMAAVAGSLLVTAAYHLGFAEFRGAALAAPLIGNGLITLGYLLTGSPVTPLVAHVLMHAAAVLHGPGSTVQLPPHY